MSRATGAILAEHSTGTRPFERVWVVIEMPDQLTFVIDPTDEFSSLALLVKSLEDIKRLLRDVDYAIYGRGSRREQDRNGQIRRFSYVGRVLILTRRLASKLGIQEANEIGS